MTAFFVLIFSRLPHLYGQWAGISELHGSSQGDDRTRIFGSMFYSMFYTFYRE